MKAANYLNNHSRKLSDSSLLAQTRQAETWAEKEGITFSETRKALPGQVQAQITVPSPSTNPQSLHQITGRVTCIRCQGHGCWYITQESVHSLHTLDEWGMYGGEKTCPDPIGVWGIRRILKSRASERGCPYRVIWLFVDHHSLLSTCTCLTSYNPQADLRGTVIPSLQIRKPRLIKDPCFAVRWHTVGIVKSQVL